MANCTFVCEKCGSSNTQIRTALPSDFPTGQRRGWLSRASDMFRETAVAFGQMAGRKLVVCKDCGHTAMIQVL